MRAQDTDFFWLGHTPCRTVLLVAMVVAVQAYDKRTIYTIDDGTAVIDCVLRRPSAPLHTELGYPVRVVGRVVRHHHSKQIYADSIDRCPSSLDEIVHLERVIQLHKTKYSLPVPFLPPPKPFSRPPPLSDTASHTDVSVFSNTSHAPAITSYTLPAPPMPMSLQIRHRPPPIPAHIHANQPPLTHVPSSPTASSIASSTPSSPCKPSSPTKLSDANSATTLQASSKPKLRHPSRLHSRDLTANTFRLYLKHYMDNAPPPFSVPYSSSPSRGTCAIPTTPKKFMQLADDENQCDEATPRPLRITSRTESIKNVDEHEPTLGFTLSHLRRVPELALLASRVVRAEIRRRDKADRNKTRDSQRTSAPSRPNGRSIATDPPRKKMKRLFSWAVVKLYEEGSIVLWDGEVRPLPVPPPPGENQSGMWHTNTLGSVDPLMSMYGSTSALYNLSASASLYSHYHAPRRQDGESTVPVFTSASALDADADTADLSDPSADEEAYVPLNTQLLAGYVRQTVNVLRRGRQGVGGGKALTAEEVLACMQRTDGRWARVGVWAVEEALAVSRVE